MRRVLLTAFEPYDRWKENASWLTLMEVVRQPQAGIKLITRRYPVDFEAVRQRFEEDLALQFDVALHLGQAPGLGRIHLEAIGLNVGGHSSQSPDTFQPLVPQGPVAYRSSLPLAEWAAGLRAQGIPCQVSYHAGTYLCNALLYLSLHLAAQRPTSWQAAFVHLPLAPCQVLDQRQDWPSLPTVVAAQAIRWLLAQLASPGGQPQAA
jgi:pyroglutamyl-peptidase